MPSAISPTQQSIDTTLKPPEMLQFKKRNAHMDRQIAELKAQIEQIIAKNVSLTTTDSIPRSVPGIDLSASTMLIVEKLEVRQVTGEQAPGFTGLALAAHDRGGAMHGKRAIGGGCRLLRQVMFETALLTRRHDQDAKRFANRLDAVVQPHRVVFTDVARKLISIANTFCKSV